MATDITHGPRILPRAEFVGILKVEERFATQPAAESTGERLNGWFDRLMVQSGTGTSPTALLMLCVVAAVALGGAAFVIRENLLLAGIAAVIGACVPVGTAMVMRSRRQSKILKQMPDMVGEMARAARTGRSLEQCVDVVAADTDGPLGDELKLCHRRMQMGLAVDAAFAELPERTGVVSLSIFTMALAVHQQTGGDLVSVLDRLARTIRDRIGFLGRLKAQTIASRATAVLMLVLPPFILAFFGFRDPEYFDKLTGNDWGFLTLLIAGVLQLVGSIWVLRILRNTRRT
jgi:tight adherence protein B